MTALLTINMFTRFFLEVGEVCCCLHRLFHRMQPGLLSPALHKRQGTQCCIMGRRDLVTCVFFPCFVSLIASLAVGLPFAILTLRHSPYRRGFYCNDDTIKYPYKEDTISHQLLGGVMIPVTIITVSAPVGLLLTVFHFLTFYSPLLSSL